MSVEGTSELTRCHELVLEILRKQDSRDPGKYDLATLHRLISEHCNAMLQEPIVPKDIIERSRSAAEQAEYIAHLKRCFGSSNLVFLMQTKNRGLLGQTGLTPQVGGLALGGSPVLNDESQVHRTAESEAVIAKFNQRRITSDLAASAGTGAECQAKYKRTLEWAAALALPISEDSICKSISATEYSQGSAPQQASAYHGAHTAGETQGREDGTVTRELTQVEIDKLKTVIEELRKDLNAVQAEAARDGEVRKEKLRAERVKAIVTHAQEARERARAEAEQAEAQAARAARVLQAEEEAQAVERAAAQRAEAALAEEERAKQARAKAVRAAERENTLAEMAKAEAARAKEAASMEEARMKAARAEKVALEESAKRWAEAVEKKKAEAAMAEAAAELAWAEVLQAAQVQKERDEAAQASEARHAKKAAELAAREKALEEAAEEAAAFAARPRPLRSALRSKSPGRRVAFQGDDSDASELRCGGA